MEERLQKILARAGIGSRRACEDLIVQGRVTVNGRPAQLGQKADAADDVVAVDGEPLKAPDKLTYVILHKPRGVVSSVAAQDDRPTVRELVALEGRLYPVGRLDADSEGLILLTNDGDLTDYLTHPRYESEKEYRVLVRGEPTAEQLAAWRRGVMLAGVRTAPAQVELDKAAHSGTWLRVTMHEGRQHQIRDIGALLGLPVQRLIRVRMGGLTLDNLPAGRWRELRRDEVNKLREPRRARERAARRPARGGPPQRRPTRKMRG